MGGVLEKITVLDKVKLPEYIEDVKTLDDLLSMPSQGLVDDFSRLDGDIMILGVGGKVGPTLARMAKRAAPGKRVIGVARFSEQGVKEALESAGVETIRCDLLNRESVAKLPDVKNIIFMAGKKFGTAGQEPFTWAMNVVAPAIIGERFCNIRFVAFSTLCVYPFVSVAGRGSAPETHPPTPLGEYANSCVGRERVFQYFSSINKNPGILVRLNYAIDLHYGALQDIALKVLNGEAIDIRTGIANVIWQGDSTNHILRCLLHGTVPARAINIGAEKPAAVRYVANEFAKIFGKEAVFSGVEQPMAWHNDTSEAMRLFGKPRVDLDTMIRWNARWLQKGGTVYHKPTHYEQREGVF